MKNFIIILGIMTLAGCSTVSPTYSIKSERGEVMSEVPKWFMADYSTIQPCSSDKEDLCLFGAGTSVSPDLNLAIEKAKMIAKAEIADTVNGEMSKNSKQYTTEVGKDGNKKVISEVESVLVNSIDKTTVRGYEVFKQDVTITTAGHYRAFVGVKLPMGSINKMYNFTPEEAMDAHQLTGGSPAKEAWEIMDIGVDDEGSNIQ